MGVAILFLKSFGAFAWEAIQLLMNPKVLVLMVLALLFGFMKGCQHEKVQFENYKALIEKVGEQQEAFTRQRNAENKSAQQEVDHANEMALEIVADELAAAKLRLSDNTRARFVPGTSPSPEQPLPSGSAPLLEQHGVACFDSEALDTGIRTSVERLQQRLARLAESSVASLTSLPEWRLWAGKVGSCPVSPTTQ